MKNIIRARTHFYALATVMFLLGCGSDGCDDKFGTTYSGHWEANLSVSSSEWNPGQNVKVTADLTVDSLALFNIEAAGNTIDKMVMLITAERMFDADGWRRFSSDELMSTILTPGGLAIEGGVSGAVTDRFGYPFKTPVDIMVEVPVPGSTDELDHSASFSADFTVPSDIPPGLYRVRADFGAKTTKRGYFDFNGKNLGYRPSPPIAASYKYSNIIQVSGTNVNGIFVDAKNIQAKIPWVILINYNSNGYRGVIAEEDKNHFALSQRNLIHDDVVLPLFSGNGTSTISYNLEPYFPADMIDTYSNIQWDWTQGELTMEIAFINDDGSATSILPEYTVPIAAKSDNYYTGPTTRNSTFTAWKPPKYGQYEVKLTGWINDTSGRRYEGGGRYRFWVAKRMTMATATFQGMAYPVGYRYGRDIGFSPPLPAEVDITATLYRYSNPADTLTAATIKKKATAGGIFGVAQGMNQLLFDSPGEYHAKIFAKATDTNGDLWVCVMTHAGIVYPVDSSIVARGKKIYVNGNYADRGETHREGYIDSSGEKHLEHISFPYNPGDLLLIASENQGLNKIEPGFIYEDKNSTNAWDSKYNGVGRTNLFIRTSNGLSPHMFPEYITDLEYFYSAAARPGFMSRFLIADSNIRAPYWPTSPNSFGGQHGASYNGDQPGDLYRFIGGIVKCDEGKTSEYAGYISSGAILPKGSNNNRIIAPGSEDIIGSNGARARFYLIGFRPGMALELGSSWRPAVQVDPLLPVTVTLTLTDPNGAIIDTVTGNADASGSWAGPTAYSLNIAGVYKYKLSATWTNSNGQTFTGKMPGLPDDTGEFYVMTTPRPAGATGLTVNLPRQSVFSFPGTLRVTGTSTSDRVHYALIMPGAVIAQGEVPVTNGSYAIDINPSNINSSTPIYDIISYVTGLPLSQWSAGKILHLSLFSKETHQGTEFWDFRRVITRGATVLSVK